METLKNLSITKVEDETETNDLLSPQEPQEFTFNPNAQEFAFNLQASSSPPPPPPPPPPPVDTVERLINLFSCLPKTRAEIKENFARHSGVTAKRSSPNLDTVEEGVEEEERSSPNLDTVEEGVEEERSSPNLDTVEEGEEEEEKEEEEEEEVKESAREANMATLNPQAKEWYPPLASVNERTVFMSFSRDLSPTRDQVMGYFRSIYGDVVEDVQLYRPRRRDADIGKIVFKYLYVTARVLNHGDSVKLYMAGKSFWLKKYQPRVCNNSKP